VIGECFTRDGLRNENTFGATELKVRFIAAAAEAGFPRIEAASHAETHDEVIDTSDSGTTPRRGCRS